MICESTNATTFRCIDKLANIESCVKQQQPRTTHLIFLQHHEVEMLNTFLGIVAHSFLKRCRIDNIADVFIDECIPL